MEIYDGARRCARSGFICNKTTPCVVYDAIRRGRTLICIVFIPWLWEFILARASVTMGNQLVRQVYAVAFIATTDAASYAAIAAFLDRAHQKRFSVVRRELAMLASIARTSGC